MLALAIQMLLAEETAIWPPFWPLALTTRGTGMRLKDLSSHRNAVSRAPLFGMQFAHGCVSTQKFFGEDPLMLSMAACTVCSDQRDPFQCSRNSPRTPRRGVNLKPIAQA